METNTGWVFRNQAKYLREHKQVYVYYMGLQVVDVPWSVGEEIHIVDSYTGHE